VAGVVAFCCLAPLPAVIAECAVFLCTGAQFASSCIFLWQTWYSMQALEVNTLCAIMCHHDECVSLAGHLMLDLRCTTTSLTRK
jgi:hypothetical protein